MKRTVIKPAGIRFARTAQRQEPGKTIHGSVFDRRLAVLGAQAMHRDSKPGFLRRRVKP